MLESIASLFTGEAVKKLTGEERIDALVKHLKEKHGIQVPPEVEGEKKDEVEPEPEQEESHKEE